jgi:hypothetical protein
MMGLCHKNIACCDSFSLKRVYCLTKKWIKKWFSTKPLTALLLFGISHQTCTVLWSSRLRYWSRNPLYHEQPHRRGSYDTVKKLDVWTD